MPERRTADTVSLALYRGGVIERPWLFAWLLTLTGTTDTVPAGIVSLRDDLTPRSVLRALASGAGIVRATIPEGYTRFEIARRLADLGIISSREEFLTRTADPALIRHYELHGDTLEGYLYPDTYDLPPGSPVEEVIDRMVRTFKRRITESRVRHPRGWRRAQEAGLDERAIVTLASLVEKETGASEDRPRVAAVFWNRLTLPGFEPRLLQSDPTIVYGCHAMHPASCAVSEPTARLPITRAMLDDATNTYNTYRHLGLPPGPIANPGTRALDAVLDPASTRDLYFVAMGSGGRSAFATTLAEHELNVQRYLRGGRATQDASRGD